MKTAQGFTLVEMLVSIAILGVLMLAFTQVFGGSLQASSEINARNELISEGQIAQQLIGSRLQSAFYIYSGINPDPNPMTLTTNGATTRNSIRSVAGQNWIRTDPFIAMLVPPETTGQCPVVGGAGNTRACFTFYAYYAVHRDTFISQNRTIAPDPDPNNADVWILMEYRANIRDGVNRSSSVTNCAAGNGQGPLSCPPLPGTAFGTAYRGQSGQMLVDYIQPTNAVDAPAYTMFRVCIPRLSTAQPNCPVGTTSTSPPSVEFDLRLLQNRAGEALTAPSGNASLNTRIYPRNWACTATANCPF